MKKILSVFVLLLLNQTGFAQTAVNGFGQAVLPTFNPGAKSLPTALPSQIGMSRDNRPTSRLSDIDAAPKSPKHHPESRSSSTDGPLYSDTTNMPQQHTGPNLSAVRTNTEAGIGQQPTSPSGRPTYNRKEMQAISGAAPVALSPSSSGGSRDVSVDKSGSESGYGSRFNQ